MVCIEKRPHILYGRSSALHFRYLTCLLDRGHITGVVTVLLLYKCQRWDFNIYLTIISTFFYFFISLFHNFST